MDVLVPIEADRWMLDTGAFLRWLESAGAGTADVVLLAVET